MTNPSPLVLINSQSQLPNGVNVTAGSTVTVALASSQFAQYPIASGTYTSVAEVLPLVGSQSISNNMEVPSGSHHIQPAVDGYYRVGANIQIAGQTITQSVFLYKTKF